MSESKLPTGLLRVALLAAVVAACVGFWWLTRRSDNIAFLPRHAGAEWIIFPTPANTAIISALPTPACFRAEFTLATVPVDATVEFAANRTGTLQVNGKQALALEGHDWKQPRSASVTSALRTGTNLLELIVTNTFGPPTAWLRLRAGDVVMATDARWEVSLAGSAWRSAALAHARPQILPGNLLYAPERESGVTIPSLLLLALAIVVGVALVWPALAGYFHRWLESPRWWLWPGLIVAILWVALAYNNLPQLPRLYGFDVEGHEEYIRYLQQKQTLPLATDGWQMYQPPLYYALSAALLNISGHQLDEAGGVLLLRGFSIVIGLAHCVVIFLCLRLLFPSARWKQIVGTLLAAFLPAHLVVSHYITNETLAALFVTSSFYFFLRATADEKAPAWLWPACGTALGLAFLTKFSAVLVLPALFAAIVWKICTDKSHPLTSWLRPVVMLLLALLLVCGWHYLRVWMAFGSPLIGNWDAASGFAWWQFPGYRTCDYYSGFGAALSQPLFSSLQSFGDGLFSTLWADGLGSGSATMAFNPPWNYGAMKAALWLSVPLTLLLGIGAAGNLRRWWREPLPASTLMLGFSALLAMGLLYMTLRVVSYAQVKAFYALAALLPLTVFFLWGWQRVASLVTVMPRLLAGLFITWMCLSYSSLWIRNSNPQKHVAWGIWFADHGDVENATRSFQRAVELSPSNAQARARWMESLTKSGRAAEALGLADVGEFPEGGNSGTIERPYLRFADDPAILFQRGMAFTALGDTNRALAAFENAAKIGTHDITALQQIALAHWRSGNPVPAIAPLREALARNPYESTLHALLGICLDQSGDSASARLHLERACAINPGLHPAQSHLGRLLLLLGEPETAAIHLRRALELAPGDIESRKNLALALQQMAMDSDAVVSYRLALQLSPDQPDVLNNLAWLLATSRDDQIRNGTEAVTLAGRACALTMRQQPAVLGTLAAALAEAGRFGDAAKTAEEAISLARSLGANEIALQNEKLLKLYQSGGTVHKSNR